MMKNTEVILIVLMFSGLVSAKPTQVATTNKAALNFVSSIGAHYAASGELITPDKLMLSYALKSYEDGYHQMAYVYFSKAAAFGNTVAQKYLGLMHIKAIGVPRDWAQGYAWIMLAAKDKSLSHLQLAKEIQSVLTAQELTQAEQKLQALQQNYGEHAALKRRDAWARQQKKQLTGSRVGGQTSNVTSYFDFSKPNGRLLSTDISSRFEEMNSFVEDYNYGQVQQGEIITTDNTPKP